jgi:Tfp pilus assembly protein PilF
MIRRLSRYALCGCLAASLGCQNPSQQSNKFADRESLGARLSFSSDDVSGLETGRGHLPSLASELADYRRQAEDDRAGGIPGGSSLTVQRLLERGHDADAHGRAQEARMYYEQVLAEAPDQADAHHRLGILADRAGDFPRAEEHYRHALRGKPNDPDVLNDLGYSYFLQGRAAESERFLNQARQIDPGHPHVSENLSLLYDPAKAEQVLLTVMGPRQTQATLAQLFQNAPMMERQEPMAPLQRSETHFANGRPGQFTEEADADSMESLQRKMEAARLQSIAERTERNAPPREPAMIDRNSSLPPLPPNYPRHVPARLAHTRTNEVPDSRINEAFRSIDGQGLALRPTEPKHSQRQSASATMPPAYEPHRLAAAQMRPNVDRGAMADQRAAAPEWNASEQPWPVHPQETMAQANIEQTNHAHTRTMPLEANSSPRMLPSAAKRAAEIGMAAGPGAIFPPLAGSHDSTPQPQGPAPAMRSLPGTDSRVNGAMYPEPGGHGVPTYWHDDNPAPYQNGASGQPADYGNGHPGQTGPHAAPNGYGPNPYDQMRAQHNAQFHRDQHALTAQQGLMSNGPPAREALPTSFDPDRHDWPAYTREQYDTRQMDPPANSQPPVAGQGRYGGQSVPQFNPATQQAPQNYGRRW